MSLNSDHHILVAPSSRASLPFSKENFSFSRSFLSDGTTKLLKSLTRRRSMALTQEGVDGTWIPHRVSSAHPYVPSSTWLDLVRNHPRDRGDDDDDGQDDDQDHAQYHYNEHDHDHDHDDGPPPK